MHKLRVLSSLLFVPILTSLVSACGPGSSSVTSIIREQFDRFVLLQRRGPADQFLMPHYTAYISALDSFIADRSFCLNSFGPCCIEQHDVDNFHAIHDRSIVDSKITSLLIVDPTLFYLPKEVVPDADLPPFTASQQAEIDTLWSVTEQALEDRPDSYVAVWSILPEGLHMLYDPRQAETCAEFEKYKNTASTSKLVTSVAMIHKVTGILMHAHLLGVSENETLQILFHATAFIFNGIRCEKLQNDKLMVPTSFYPFYYSRMNKAIAALGESPTAIPQIQPDIIAIYLADSLRVLSSYKSWGRIEQLRYDGVTTEKRNIKVDIFAPLRISQILSHMLDHTLMTDAQKIRVQAKRTEINLQLSTQVQNLYGLNNLPSTTSLPQSIVYRQSVTCTAGLFHAYPVDPATALSECCADLCDQTSLLQTLTPPLTKADCCFHCNEASCDVEDNPSNPLSAIEEVHLIPYYEGGSEVVNL